MVDTKLTMRPLAFLLLAAALLFATGCKKVGGSGVDSKDNAEAGAVYTDSGDKFEIAEAPVRGSNDALITIVEFSDYQCPFCSRVEPTLNELQKDYGDDIRVVFKHLALPFHNQALPAAHAARAAQLQGKFWEYHDKLFANQKDLNDDNYVKWAEELGLDVEQFKADKDSDETKAFVQADMDLASKLNVRGTPNFFINGTNLRGAQPIEKFKEVIDEELKAMKGLVADGKTKAEALSSRIENNAKAPDADAAAQPQKRTVPDPDDVLYVPVENSYVRGDKNALVTLVLFSDFQCPFCSRVEPTLADLEKKYGKDLRVVWKHQPLSFHNRALPAALAAEAAGQQGKFWEYHDKLFENQKDLSDDAFIKYAEELGLNIDKFKKDLESDELKAKISADQELAKRVGASGTPHSFVNGVRLSGAQPVDRFEAVIDAQLKIAKEKLDAKQQKNDPYAALQADANQGPAKMKTENAPGQPAAAPTKPVNIPVTDEHPAKGPKDAKVTLVEYTDFQCPFCKRFSQTLDQVIADNPEIQKNVRVVVKQFPLGMHRDAHLAAEASLAAHAQGKFWEYHDLLWENQNALGKDALIAYAEQLGLDVPKFTKALDDGTYKDRTDAEFKEGSGFGVRGTPTWFVNGKTNSGALPADQLKQVLLDEIKAAK